MTRERKVSSVTIPPALRMMCASPVFRPRVRIESRVSIQVRTSSLRSGRGVNLRNSCVREYISFAATISSMTLMAGHSLTQPHPNSHGQDGRCDGGIEEGSTGMTEIAKSFLLLGALAGS